MKSLAMEFGPKIRKTTLLELLHDELDIIYTLPHLVHHILGKFSEVM